MKPHEITQGTTDAMLGPRQNILPFDDMDDMIRVCALCGLQSEYPRIRRTVTTDNRVEQRCADVHACLKRRPRR